VNPLSLTCYGGDRHGALFGGSVHPVGDLVQSLCKVSDGESLAETTTPFVPLPVAVTSGVLVVGSFISGCVGGQLVF
jgi:hypothetical protein